MEGCHNAEDSCFIKSLCHVNQCGKNDPVEASLIHLTFLVLFKRLQEEINMLRRIYEQSMRENKAEMEALYMKKVKQEKNFVRNLNLSKTIISRSENMKRSRRPGISLTFWPRGPRSSI